MRDSYELQDTGCEFSEEIPYTTFFATQSQSEPQELTRPLPSFDWFFATVLLYFALLAVVRLLAPALVFPIGQRKKQRTVISKGDSVSSGLLFVLILCSWLGFSLALAEVLSFWHFPFPFSPLLFTPMLIFCYFSVKYILKKIVNKLFRFQDLASEQMPLANNANFIGTLLAFPLIVINHYMENNFLIWAICVIFGINFLQKLFLSGRVFFKKLRILEILLYLCTIEILPLLLLARYIVDN